MQHVAVDVVGPQVLERAGHRLRDLRGQVGRGVVGQPVVLAALVRELRLQEEIRARDHARAVGGGERLADSGLEVVPPLVGGVDAPEARPERELGEGRGAVFLPGGAVEELGNACRRCGRACAILPWPGGSRAAVSGSAPPGGSRAGGQAAMAAALTCSSTATSSSTWAEVKSPSGPVGVRSVNGDS